MWQCTVLLPHYRHRETNQSSVTHNKRYCNGAGKLIEQRRFNPLGAVVSNGYVSTVGVVASFKIPILETRVSANRNLAL